MIGYARTEKAHQLWLPGNQNPPFVLDMLPHKGVIYALTSGHMLSTLMGQILMETQDLSIAFVL